MNYSSIVSKKFSRPHGLQFNRVEEIHCGPHEFKFNRVEETKLSYGVSFIRGYNT